MRTTIRNVAQTAFLVALLLSAGSKVRAQEPGEQAGQRGGQFAGLQRVMGEVTAVSPDKLTVKAEDGTVYQVVTTPNTRMMKSGGVPFKVADLKPGDGVMSAGNLDAPNKTLHAAMLVMIDAEQVKKAKAAREQMMANLGKTLIMGRVTAVDLDNAKLTVMRPDNVSQTITLDESTSFRRGVPGRVGAGEAAGMGFGGFNMGARPSGAAGNGNAPSSTTDAGESITLADVKVGDNISGPGVVKNGAFVPAQLVVRTPRAGGGRRSGGQGGQQGTPPASTGPGGQ